jgi:excisionase family DNA binding protein
MAMGLDRLRESIAENPKLAEPPPQRRKAPLPSVFIASPKQSTADVFSLDQTADYLKVSNDTVYRLARKKLLPGYKAGRDWHFRISDLNAWVAKGGAETHHPKRQIP